MSCQGDAYQLPVCILSSLLLSFLQTVILLLTRTGFVVIIVKRETHMNITLRKANAIQNNILEAIKGIKVELTVNLNEFQDPEAAIKAANDLVLLNDQRRAALLTAYYNIRGLVGQANSASGIDLLLTKAAYLDKRTAQVEELAKSDVMTNADVIKGKLDKIRNDKSERSRLYGYGDTVATGVLIQDQLDKLKKQVKDLKKQKQTLNDEVLELNIKTEIPLSEDVVKVLATEGLI